MAFDKGDPSHNIHFRDYERRRHMLGSFPTLSLKERDRRRRLTRKLMKERSLDCLLVAGLKGREKYESYFTNEYAQGIVVFPMDKEPVYVTWGSNVVLRHMEKTLKKEKWWVNDIRPKATGPGLVEIIKEKGLDQARIGVVGLESRGPQEMEGIIPYMTWSYLLENLPNATFVDVSTPFAEMIMVKSDEELRMVRYSAEIGELACKTMLKVTRAGVPETEIYAATTRVIHQHGAISTTAGMILVTGPENMSWGPPIWAHRGGTPRIIRKGDIVLAEIFPIYGGFETQQQMGIGVKPVLPVHKECAEVARRSYDAGIKTLRPGNTFIDVCNAMEVPIAEAGCWHLTPLIHSMSPLIWVSSVHTGIEQVPGARKAGARTVPPLGSELKIKPGMVFALEPNACKGKYRVNIGGTVIVKKDGVEELNKLPNELQLVG
jgi:Xaa-Pro dipeptidase